MHYVVSFLSNKTTNKYRLERHLTFLKTAPVSVVTMIFPDASDYETMVREAELPMPVYVLSTNETLHEYAWNRALVQSTIKSPVFVIDGGRLPENENWLQEYRSLVDLWTGYIKSPDSTAGYISARMYGIIRRSGFWGDRIERGAPKSSEDAMKRLNMLASVKRFNIIEASDSHLKAIRKPTKRKQTNESHSE